MPGAWSGPAPLAVAVAYPFLSLVPLVPLVVLLCLLAPLPKARAAIAPAAACARLAGPEDADESGTRSPALHERIVARAPSFLQRLVEEYTSLYFVEAPRPARGIDQFKNSLNVCVQYDVSAGLACRCQH